MFRIIILKKHSAKSLQDINRLLSQIGLTSVKPKPVSPVLFKSILAQPNLKFIAAVAGDGTIVGMLILYFIRIPSGLSAWLEDLVVDTKLRQWGLGRSLVEKAIMLAKKKKARHLSLRTNPVRTQANKLYQQLGFFKVETNFYRINLFR